MSLLSQATRVPLPPIIGNVTQIVAGFEHVLLLTGSFTLALYGDKWARLTSPLACRRGGSSLGRGMQHGWTARTRLERAPRRA